MPMVFCPPPFFSTQVLLRISPPLPSPSFYLFLATEHHFLRSSSRSYKRLIFRCKHKKKRQEEDLSSDDLHLSTDGKSSRQRSLKQQIKRRALLSYRNRFTQALQAELTEELQEIKGRLKQWSNKKLESEGLALFDLSLREEGRLFRDRILRLYLSTGDGILPPHNQFSQGDLVVMSRNHPLSEDEAVVEAVVVERARRFIKVAVPWNKSRDLNFQKKWRLDLYANHVAYERCLFAVDVFSSPMLQQHNGRSHLEAIVKVSDIHFGSSLESSFAVGEGASAIRGLIMKCQELHSRYKKVPLDTDDIPESLNEVNSTKNPPSQISGKILVNARGGVMDFLYSTPKQAPFDSHKISEVLDEVKATKSPPSHMSRKSLPDAKGIIRAYLQNLGTTLNTSQKIAIETAAFQRVTLWQGPPGTGKTKTLTHLIAALCRQHLKVLACADSNVAVDNMVEGLLKLGLQVVRIGQPVKVKFDLRECTMDALLAKHPLMKRVLETKRKSADQMRKSRHLNNTGRRADGVNNSKRLWEKAEDLEARALKDVLDRADVIASTCIGAGDEVLMNRSFNICVIDEATQATEPATLVPILRSGADGIVLVGDPAQLPPTVLSSKAIVEGLDVSLYQHLQECGLNPCFLDTQYRMHPEISALPSKLFYSGRLKTELLPSDRPAPCGFHWPDKGKPITFVDCLDGKEESTFDGNSMFNHAEATLVLKFLQLLKSGKDIQNGWEGIGVISPYNAQVRLLHDMLCLDGNGKDDKFFGLEVKTVDGFQGREKEVIVFSTVRSNSKGQLGFVSDPRRMNVALTRAKCGLIVIGNSKTLEHDKSWAIWLTYMKKHNLISVIKACEPCK